MSESLTALWPAAALVGGLAGLIFLSRLLLRDEPARPPYERRPSLLTEAEQAFYHALREAAAGRWEVQAMVRLADVLVVRDGAADRGAWQSRINAKHLDFVLCEHGTLAPRLAIELDDATHQRPDRQERDAFVEAGLEAAGLPLLRVPVAPRYDAKELHKTLAKMAG